MNLKDFNEYQKEQINQGQKSGVNIALYADPKFCASQMEAIRLGLEKGLDVSIYADPKYD